MSILLLNGPNLNLLGSPAMARYGDKTLAEIEAILLQQAHAAKADLFCFQSNHEGALIDRLHQAQQEGIKYAIINPAALSHTSIALREAFSATQISFVEVHISNIFQRETFRHHSYFSSSEYALGVICGLGWKGYVCALRYILNFSQKSQETLHQWI